MTRNRKILQGMVECIRCKHKKQRTLIGRYPSGQIICVDQDNKKWKSQICPQCWVDYTTRRDRAHGCKPRDELTGHRIVKARKAEIAVRDFFVMLGNRVEVTTGKGPDLIIDTVDKRFTCEVKSVTANAKEKTLRVGKVTNKCKDNDYIAYVYGERIHITTMKEHLKKTHKHGSKTVTEFFPGAQIR